MASLQTVLQRRQVVPNEDGLEPGEITTISGNEFASATYGWYWQPRACGTLRVEAWGAGGSGAQMCCCGGGLPGNSGAYVRKFMCVTPSTAFCGVVGQSCKNAAALCFRGCSEATCFCFSCVFCCGTCYAGCLCAQGGLGGTSYCSTGTSLFCCFGANGWCRWVGSPANCGVICNIGTNPNATYQANGFLSVCNCVCDFVAPTTISCVSFFGAEPSCNVCFNQYHIAVPYGIFADCHGLITYSTEIDNGFSSWSGMGKHQFNHALNGMSRYPTRGIHWTTCYSSTRACGCYENEGCVAWAPYGFGGTPPSPCVNVRDHAGSGGNGAIRFTFYPYNLT